MVRCPFGYICNTIGADVTLDGKISCAEIKADAPGELLHGIYCHGTILNCPAGNYCPDPESGPILCPKGYYCPTKTQNFNDYPCPSCPEGSAKYSINIALLAVLISIFLAVPLLVTLVMMATRYAKDEKKKEQGLQDAQALSSIKDTEYQKKRQAQLQRIKPMIIMMDEKLGDAYSALTNEQGDLVDFIPNRLFNALDVDGNGWVDFNELNRAMDMAPHQLSIFMSLMNEGSGDDETKVSREVFEARFLDTITAVENLNPTTEESLQLFDEIAESYAHDDDHKEEEEEESMAVKIPLNWLKLSQLAMFLSDRQILILVRLFQKRLGFVKVDEVPKGEGEESNLVAGENLPMRSTFKFRMTVREESGGFIGREEFGKMYPDVLKDMFNTQDAQLHPFDLQFENLSLHVTARGESFPVVNDVSGRLRSKTMTALMGGSGAGKTSLLNALCGRAHYGVVSGEVVINGQEAKIEDNIGAMGFVPQDDIVYAELTVRENLIFAGLFRLPEGTTKHQIEEYAEEAIADLGLSRVADSMVGDVHRRGVSGGEKKRVNIGLELMAKPSILFLDEPTSGLDSSSALLVLSSLSRLVQNQGMTICAVIHQPRKTIFDLFDSLILLGVGGNMVYHGPVEDAQTYFTNKDYHLPIGEALADWLIDISTGRLNQKAAQVNPTIKEMSEIEIAKANRKRLYKEWITHMANLPAEKRGVYEAPEPFDLPSERTKASFALQTFCQVHRFGLLFQRNMSTKITEILMVLIGVIVISVLMKPLVLSNHSDPDVPNEYDMITIAMDSEDSSVWDRLSIFFYMHSIKSYLLTSVFFMVISAMISLFIALSSSTLFSNKRVEFFREASSGYNTSAFFLGLTIFDILDVSIKTVLAGLFCYALRNSAASIGPMILQFVLLGWISSSWGVLLSFVVQPESLVIYIGFFVMFFGMVFSGALMALNFKMFYENGFMNVVSGMLSGSRFFVESLLVNEFKATYPQHGFTIKTESETSPQLKLVLPENSDTPPVFANAFEQFGLGQNDADNVYIQSTDGWYWTVLSSVLVGLTIRVLSFIMLQLRNRHLQLKKPILEAMRGSAKTAIATILMFACFFTCFGLSIWSILRKN